MNILESGRGSEVETEWERESRAVVFQRGGIEFKLWGYLAHPQWPLCKYFTKDFMATHTQTAFMLELFSLWPWQPTTTTTTHTHPGQSPLKATGYFMLCICLPSRCHGSHLWKRFQLLSQISGPGVGWVKGVGVLERLPFNTVVGVKCSRRAELDKPAPDSDTLQGLEVFMCVTAVVQRPKILWRCSCFNSRRRVVLLSLLIKKFWSWEAG